MTEAIKVLPVQRALQGRGTYSQAESICTRTESCSWQPERQTRRLCLRIKWQYKTNCMQTSSECSLCSPSPCPPSVKGGVQHYDFSSFPLPLREGSKGRGLLSSHIQDHCCKNNYYIENRIEK